MERISKTTEWASRLEAAALAEPVVRHTSIKCLGVRVAVTRYGSIGCAALKLNTDICADLLQLFHPSAVCLDLHPPYGSVVILTWRQRLRAARSLGARVS